MEGKRPGVSVMLQVHDFELWVWDVKSGPQIIKLMMEVT